MWEGHPWAGCMQLGCIRKEADDLLYLTQYNPSSSIYLPENFIVIYSWIVFYSVYKPQFHYLVMGQLGCEYSSHRTWLSNYCLVRCWVLWAYTKEWHSWAIQKFFKFKKFWEFSILISEMLYQFAYPPIGNECPPFSTVSSAFVVSYFVDFSNFYWGQDELWMFFYFAFS